MKLVKIALITLAVLMLSTLGSALVMPTLFGSLTNFPSSTVFEPINIFSIDTTNGNSISIPLNIDGSLASNKLQWPSPGDNKGNINQILPTPTLDPEVTAYNNAPAITQEQREEALKIASTSDIYKEYMQYPNSGLNCYWQYPYDGHTITVSSNINQNNPSANVYGHMYITVNIDNGSIVNAGFTDWHKYW